MSERPFSQATSPMIVAHRGASHEVAENTLEAFELAVALGADAVEFDVRITADGHAVVMHDPEVDRTTDGTGLVGSLTLDEIRSLLIALPSGRARVPTLTDALSLLSGRAAVDIEIKNIPGEPDFDPERELAVEAVHRELDATGFVGQAIISSFNPLSIARSRAGRPDIATGLLTEYRVDAIAALRFAAEQGHPWVLPFSGKVLEAGPAFPDVVHEAGLLLGTWLTDDAGEAVALARSGVDAIATNDPRGIVVAVRAAPA